MYRLTDYTNGEITETNDVELFYALAEEARDNGYEVVKNSRMDWEIHYSDEEPYEDWDDEIGYDPYAGCYTWDC